MVAVRVSADGSDKFNSLRQGELFARVSGDEATAAKLPGGFQSAQDGHQFAPRRSNGFALEQIAKQNAPAGQQEASEVLGPLV